MANSGETMETARELILGSKITADGDCSHEIKRCLILGRKAMTRLDSILKSRDITLTTKVHLVKAMVIPVVMYGCESRTKKKAEHRRIDAFELWCWRRLLRVPWAARRSNQSILKEISPEYSLERLMLMLKLQYSGYLMRRADSFEKTVMLGKIEGRNKSLFSSVQLGSGTQSCPTLCDPMDCSTPGFPFHYQLPGLAQTRVHRVGDTIQSSHSLSSLSPTFNLSQHQGVFQ